MELTYKIKRTESIEVNVEKLAKTIIEDYGGIPKNSMGPEYIISDMIWIFYANVNNYLMEYGLPEDVDLEDEYLKDLEEELEKIFIEYIKKELSK